MVFLPDLSMARIRNAAESAGGRAGCVPAGMDLLGYSHFLPLKGKLPALQLCVEHLKSKEDAQALDLGLCALPWWVELYLNFHFCSQAERMFSEVRRIENYRVEGMEIYSTTLWHLQKDVALSVLSKDLTDMDKNSPEVQNAE